MDLYPFTLVRLSYFFLRALSGVDPPDPISNSEVKHASADDTWRVASWESRSVRGIYFKRVKGIILQLWMMPLMYAGVAQLVEHYLAKVDVASSNLVSRSSPQAPTFMEVGAFIITLTFINDVKGLTH